MANHLQKFLTAAAISGNKPPHHNYRIIEKGYLFIELIIMGLESSSCPFLRNDMCYLQIYFIEIKPMIADMEKIIGMKVL